MLNKEQILNADDLELAKVPVPEWAKDEFVWVRGMTGTDRDAFETRCAKAKEMKNFENVRAELLVYSITDEKGNRLFTKDDISALNKKNAKVIDRLVEEAKKVSGISDDLEDLEKN